MTTQKITVGLAIAAAAIFMAGCTPEAKDKYGAAGKDVKQAAGNTGDAIKTDAVESGAKIQQGAANAGAAVGAVGDKIGEGTDEVRTSVMVKTAIANTKDLAIDDFGVTVVGKVATLKGSATQANKDRAGVLAKQSLGADYSVQNDIVVK